MSIRVSIIENDASLRSAIRERVAGERRFDIVSDYASAEAAIKHLPKDQPDLVLSDVAGNNPSLTWNESPSGVWKAVDGSNTWTDTESSGTFSLAVSSGLSFESWATTNKRDSFATPGIGPCVSSSIYVSLAG